MAPLKPLSIVFSFYALLLPPPPYLYEYEYVGAVGLHERQRTMLVGPHLPACLRQISFAAAYARYMNFWEIPIPASQRNARDGDAPLALCWFWGSEFRASRLHGKCFTHWTIPSATVIQYLLCRNLLHLAASRWAPQQMVLEQVDVTRKSKSSLGMDLYLSWNLTQLKARMPRSSTNIFPKPTTQDAKGRGS